MRTLNPLTRPLALSALCLLAGFTTAQDGGRAKKADGPSFLSIAAGAKVQIKGAKDENLGLLQDHVIDRESGRVLFVVVGVKEESGDTRSCLVPFQRFKFDAEKEELRLPVSSQEVLSMAEYDPADLQSVGEMKSGSADSPKSGTTPGKAKGDQENDPDVKLVRFLSSSSVIGSGLLAENDPFGTVSELVFEPTSGTVAFLLAKGPTGGDPYVIPWKATTWKAGGRADATDVKNGSFVLPLAVDEMLEAPRLKGSDPAHIEGKKAIDGIYGFYKLTPPPFAVTAG